MSPHETHTWMNSAAIWFEYDQRRHLIPSSINTTHKAVLSRPTSFDSIIVHHCKFMFFLNKL